MNREPLNHGVFLHRDSGGKHDQSLEQYVEWAGKRCEKLSLVFDGSPTLIREMIQSKCSVRGDIYLDYVVKGNKLSRPGLDALRKRAQSDATMTHIFIARRDRLARPDDPVDGLDIENEFRRMGKTVVYQDGMVKPLGRGDRADIGETINTLIQFDKAGGERRELARKVLYAQMNLAQRGYSTGGRAPFGFRRVLVNSDGTIIRVLMDGERVHIAGCHVVHLPGPEVEVKLALRIREMLKIQPATRVADVLNAEGIPSPDAGRVRTDSGISHMISGRWNPTTIVNIGRNPLFMAWTRYGLRSMGDQLRFSPEGPRQLTESDATEHSQTPKVIRNPESDQIRAQASFDPLIPPEEHEHLQQVLDTRAGSQRGKPRSRTPHRNPLGARIFDMTCGWPMYRVARSESFTYTCGLYQQSHSKACDHNRVDGPLVTKFALSSIQQFLLRPGMIEKLREKLRIRAELLSSRSTGEQELKGLQNQLTRVKSDLQKVAKNMALADNDEQRVAMRDVFNELKTQEGVLALQLDARSQLIQRRNPEQEVAQVMQIVEHLQDLVQKTDDMTAIENLFKDVNLRLFLKFKKQQLKKRSVNRVAGGIITFGNAEPPIPLYAGRTDTKSVKAALQPTANLQINSVSDEEVNSSRNVNRGDRI